MHVATTGQIDHRVITRHQKMSMREAAAFEHDGVKFLALSYRETSRALFPGRTPAIGADLRNLDRGWHARCQTRPLAARPPASKAGSPV